MNFRLNVDTVSKIEYIRFNMNRVSSSTDNAGKICAGVFKMIRLASQSQDDAHAPEFGDPEYVVKEEAASQDEAEAEEAFINFQDHSFDMPYE